MVNDQIDAWAWRDRGQALQEFVRGKDQVARAVVPRMPERADDAAVGESREPFLRERRAQKVSAVCGPTRYADLRDHFVVTLMD